jgi:hypothetical protein
MKPTRRSTDVTSPPPDREKRRTIIDVPPIVLSFPEAARAGDADQGRSRDVNQLSRPPGMNEDIHRFQVSDFAEHFFRERHVGHLLGRRAVPIEALARWQSEPLTHPLLSKLEKSAEKLAVDCFRTILQYTGATASQQAGSPALGLKLVRVIASSVRLRDEVFFQLIKQTRNCPVREVLIRSWELFVVVASFFPSTSDSETWIKAYCALVAEESPADDRVGELAQFSYIRFAARCAIGKAEDVAKHTAQTIKDVTRSVDEGHRTFGASIYEQLWNQRRQRPDCPVPYFLPYVSNLILAKGAEKAEGIFRISGNGRVVKELEAEVEEGHLAVLEGAALHDLGSLFESWFASLPELIVNDDLAKDLQVVMGTTRDVVSFTEKLPRAYAITLQFLIGFLKRLTAAEPETKMTARNYGIVFGPNIVAMGDVTDALASHASKTASEFVAQLIEDWDTSAVYPLSPQTLGE